MTSLKFKEAINYVVIATVVGASGGFIGSILTGGEHLFAGVAYGAGIGLVTVILYVWKKGVR